MTRESWQVRGDDPDSQVTRAVLLLLEQRKMTRKALAEGIGISRHTLAFRLNGKFPWLAREVYAIAEHLGVDPCVLVPPREKR